MTKIIAIDLDGVLNMYDGKYDENYIPLMRAGADKFLSDLTNEYDIEIFTVRNKELDEKWLKENNLFRYVKNITDKKNPRTTLFIDDRALNFNGDFSDVLCEIKNFVPHWKKKK